ncbi:hypothetical protein GQ457_01G027170 [Hibiscus cannabinus]
MCFMHLHNFSLKGKFIFSPTKQASSLNLSRGDISSGGPNEVLEAPRSWTFGFDSSIPRVTISGRFCDWTGSRGLQECSG